MAKKVKLRAPAANSFFLCDGAELKTLEDLEKALDSMPDWIFSHHVTAERNDFATWIKDVYGEEDFATQVSAQKDRTKMQVVILRKLLQE
ncbi:hypothetical protein J4460_06415 [Candidatus Woesearchaeota archaeon]|nr:MAG: hypothetical protein QS99_C0010G0043 [archaeon GW2011_AR4]MBS3130277.1 hypothetical protein [Candidatus Woesearchaeota archaeon]HIH38208.1 hypothetical protein [Candidatus Woesearchaeota archaeon]HIH49503.1 hypothetical protein [Candidatus Woesearchaeota archaeon]HIJ03885.1 hypothetical protein [Candidatus Woesearchaeota archaeon]